MYTSIYASALLLGKNATEAKACMMTEYAWKEWDVRFKENTNESQEKLFSKYYNIEGDAYEVVLNHIAHAVMILVFSWMFGSTLSLVKVVSWIVLDAR